MMDVPYAVVDSGTSVKQLGETMEQLRTALSEGKQVALVIRKGVLSSENGQQRYHNTHSLLREDALREIVAVSGNDIIVSTTGKTSRELFEIREANGQGHERDFLTVGSMGHASSIALGIALQNPNKRIWCIDGDGAVLMHMGAMAVIGQHCPSNLVHIVINNEAHESVGGLPTAGGVIDFCKVAEGYGYQRVVSADSRERLRNELIGMKGIGQLILLEIKCVVGSRKDLERPTITPERNKQMLMNAFSSKEKS